jgi:exo-beta-1,3-glucanase (GH17 family)
MRRNVFAAVSAFVLLAALTVAAWGWVSLPVPVVDAPSARLPCLSYAPYRAGQSPFDEGLVIPRAQIEEDLRLLAGVTDCVRTYSVDQGLDQVPQIAEALGLKVMLGAWVGREAAKNDKELARLIDLANRFPATVRAVIVGNEVLLRREQPAEQLAALIRRVKGAVPVPVTYADVWEFWLKHPEVAPAVDFITVHMLPYWEDEPIAVHRAIPHVLSIWQEVAAAFPGHAVFIGEAGWPSAGRMREGARPGRVEQAAFVRGLVAAAAERGIGLNLIEAFDQPWKRKMEGTVGGHWGLFDAARQAKFALKGAIEPYPQWQRLALATVLIAAIPLVVVVVCRVEMPFPAALALALAAHAAAAAIVIAGVEAFDASLTLIDWLTAKMRLVLSAAAFGLVAQALWQPPESGRVTAAGVFAAAAARRLPAWAAVAPFALAVVRVLTLIVAAATTLALLFDPRYRDFPVAATLVPAGAFLLLALLRPSGARDDREGGLLALLLALAGAAVVWREGLANTEALAWGGVCALLALAVALDRRLAPQAESRKARRRARTSAAAPAPAP